MKRTLHVCLIAIAAVACLMAVSGGLPSGAADAAAAGATPPWDGAAPFPSVYDLRAEGRVTPVRQQDAFSTCWIMAATASLESATITAEHRPYDFTVDFSENNLADHMASRLVYEGRAPSELAAAYYARWEGPVSEASDPYPRPGQSPEYLRAVRHVQEVLFLPKRTAWDDNAAVKWAVMTYGGVDAAACFHTQPSAGYWNDETSAYYSDASGELNHHILCVGWDDAYPAANFLARPPHDGAFLIKNSWGTDFGDAGYLWVSYCDVNFGRALAVFNGVEPVADHDAIYQHDALGRSGWVDGLGQSAGAGGESAWYASRYTCAGSGDVTAVSFYTPAPGTAYEVRVAGSVADIASAPAVASGTVAVGGYHTLPLERPAAVTAGRVFVVAVRVTAPGRARPVPVERPSALIAPWAAPGQSYVSADGVAWHDLTALPGLSQADVCLKAFVDSAGAGDTQPPKAVVGGGVVRRGGVAAVRWRLTDPAFSSASAIVVLKVRDARGAVLAQRRLPAVVVGARGTWSVRAVWPAGAYTVTGRAYDVAGNRQPAASSAALRVHGSAPSGGLPRH